MQEQNVNPDLQSRSSRRLHRKTRLGLVAAGLLVFLALAAVAVNQLVPNLPGRENGIQARVNWYVHHGQLRADTRTLAAAVDYLLTPDGDTSKVGGSTNPVVAGQASPTTPKS